MIIAVARTMDRYREEKEKEEGSMDGGGALKRARRSLSGYLP